MATKYRVALRAVSNVAASKTAIIECPIGKRYHQIILQHGYASGTNTIAAAYTNIAEVRVLVNNRVQRVCSGTQLRDKNLLNCYAFNATTPNFDALVGGVPNTAPGVSIPLYFAEPWLTDEQSQDALAWPTNLWERFHIEVDLGAASTPTLLAYAVVDNAQAKNQPLISKWIRASKAAASTSFDITDIDKRDYLRVISIYPDSGGSNAPSRVTFRLNGEILHELTLSANQALLQNSLMAPAASSRTSNIYDLVFDHDGLLGSSVPMDGARDVTMTIEAASTMSGTSTYIIERLGTLE